MGFAKSFIGGSVIQSTLPPSSKTSQWIDISSGSPEVKIFDSNTNEWVAVSGGSKTEIVNTITERDTLTKSEGLSVFVSDATLDESVDLGWAIYSVVNDVWVKTAEQESLDIASGGVIDTISADKVSETVEKQFISLTEKSQITTNTNKITEKMYTLTYDSTDNGVVDNSEKLGNQLPEYYAKQSDITTLQDNLDNKSNTNHNHVLSNLTDVDDTSKLDGNILKWDEALGKHVYVEIPSSGDGDTIIVDDVTSTSVTSALSANQGRVLKQEIDTKSTFDGDYNNLINKPVDFSELEKFSVDEGGNLFYEGVKIAGDYVTRLIEENKAYVKSTYIGTSYEEFENDQRIRLNSTGTSFNETAQPFTLEKSGYISSVELFLKWDSLGTEAKDIWVKIVEDNNGMPSTTVKGSFIINSFTTTDHSWKSTNPLSDSNPLFLEANKKYWIIATTFATPTTGTSSYLWGYSLTTPYIGGKSKVKTVKDGTWINLEGYCSFKVNVVTPIEVEVLSSENYAKKTIICESDNNALLEIQTRLNDTDLWSSIETNLFINKDEALLYVLNYPLTKMKIILFPFKNTAYKLWIDAK